MRTTCSDEMLATPLTAWPAMRVKSGPPTRRRRGRLRGRRGDGSAALRGAGSISVRGGRSARESEAVRIRPVTTSPAAKPATRARANEDDGCRRITDDFDMRWTTRVGRLRQRHGEDAVLQIGGDALDVDRFRQRERAREAAVAALDPVVLLAGHVFVRGAGAARAADDDAVVFGVDLDLVAGEARQFRGEDELGRRLVEIDRRRPARRVGADELTELLVQREQVAQRIPARETPRSAS